MGGDLSLSLSFCLSLSHHRRASSLRLLPGRWLRDYQECLEPSNLLLDSWMEQKGVDGFLFLFGPFIFSRLEQASCCGDDTEEGSPHTCTTNREPASVDLGSPKGIFSFFFLLWGTQQQQQQKAEGTVRDMEEGKEEREGEKEENT